FPEALGSRVAGLVFIQTTYTNPLRTAVLGGLLTALQRPVIQPLLHLTIWLSPLVRVMIWLSYYNGTMHFFNALTGFAGTQSRGQLELVSRYPLFASPAALARGGLATLAFHEAQTLPRISVPSLIISGAQDKVTTPVASAFMQQAIPAAEHVQVAPAGHMGPFERHEQEIAALRRFAEATFA
ncbi:MAG TPA: alpha/beta hydrolase, partial [Ardenticatenaceae bacterium]|nr:alpha/beta hydrolase [Ardenticatenaceae bacterium]